MVEFKTIAATPPGADTRDIISAIQAALIPAVVSYKKNFQDLNGLDAYNAAITAAKKIQANVKYKADGYQYQKIKLPARLFNDKIGDCKSFSLFIAAALTAAKIPNGLRFASYKKNLIPTHVYNFVVVDGEKKFIDSCVESLNESKNYTFVKDMQVQYLTGLPILTETGSEIGRRRTRSQRQEQRQQRRTQRQEKRKNKPSPVKKVALAPARSPFLALLSLNFRGIASRLAKLNKTKPDVVKSFWLRLGGDPTKILKAIETGKTKKPLLGGNINGATQAVYLGEPVTASALVAAAGSILLALQSLFKKEGIATDDFAPENATPLDTAGTGFDVTDTETPEARNLNQLAVRRASTQNTTGSSSTTLLIGAAALAAFLMFKK